MKKIRLTLAVALSLALSSCAIFRGRPAVYPSGLIFPLSVSASLDFPGAAVGSPVIDSGRLYLATDKGVVCAVDLAGRTMAWQYVAFGPLAGAPVLSGDALAVLDTDGRLYGLDKGDGHLRWQAESRDEGQVWLCEAGGNLIVSGPSGLVVCRSPADGREAWRYQAPEGLVLAPVVRSYGLPNLLLFDKTGTARFLGLDGRPGSRVSLKGVPSAEPLVERNLLYFGTTDRWAECFDLSAGKSRWRVDLPGTVICRPLAFGRNLFLWTSHGALYCLRRTSGDIDWWTSVASRLTYPPLIVEKRILVSFSSPNVMSFEIESGKPAGTFNAGLELSGPLQWVAPSLLICGFDRAADKGRLLFLGKEVSVALKASKDSPQGPLDEIVLVARATGFFKPKYEFFLTGAGPEETVQEASEENSWSWFPDKEGEYKIRVLVTDEKEKAEAVIPFTISAAAAKKAPAAKTPEAKPAAKKPPVKKKPPIKK
jgi:outer membrane protein assembly factor BamB